MLTALMWILQKFIKRNLITIFFFLEELSKLFCKISTVRTTQGHRGDKEMKEQQREVKECFLYVFVNIKMISYTPINGMQKFIGKFVG